MCKIGDLNGRTSRLFVINQFLIPLMGFVLTLGSGWAVWMTNEQYADRAFRESGERFDKEDGRVLEDRQREARHMLQSTVDARFDAVDKQLTQLQRDVDRLATLLEQRM